MKQIQYTQSTIANFNTLDHKHAEWVKLGNDNGVWAWSECAQHRRPLPHEMIVSRCSFVTRRGLEQHWVQSESGTSGPETRLCM